MWGKTSIEAQLINVTGIPALVAEDFGDPRAQALVHKEARQVKDDAASSLT